MTPTIVFVTGDRHWSDETRMEETLAQHNRGGTVWLVHGGARGADQMAHSIAGQFGWQTLRMDANWTLGKPAGPIRNHYMGTLLYTLKEARYSIHAYAFHDDLANSKGTKDMTRVINRLGIDWVHVTSKGSSVPTP